MKARLTYKRISISNITHFTIMHKELELKEEHTLLYFNIVMEKSMHICITATFLGTPIAIRLLVNRIPMILYISKQIKKKD